MGAPPLFWLEQERYWLLGRSCQRILLIVLRARLSTVASGQKDEAMMSKEMVLDALKCGAAVFLLLTVACIGLMPSELDGQTLRGAAMCYTGNTTVDCTIVTGCSGTVGACIMEQKPGKGCDSSLGGDCSGTNCNTTGTGC